MTLKINFISTTDENHIKALCRILEQKYLEQNFMILRTNSEDLQEEINDVLWTFSKKSFIPHGSKFDDKPELHNLYITTGVEIPNNANLLILYNLFSFNNYDIKYFKEILVIFNNNDPLIVSEAREFYKKLKNENYELAFIKA
ncbi:MAG: DNA polymerase III subunit chi [Rickettsiaceae bacterium]|nr:DNA polymerase III subunit chi [Rickettsiaceae bacterium]